MAKDLLVVENLNLFYPVKIKTGLLGMEKKQVRAVDNISFAVPKGQTLGIVGESGCGKSTTGKVIVKLLKPTEGKVYYQGQDIFELSGQADMDFKKEVQMIFQDPYSSLDPRFTVSRIIGEPLSTHKMGNGKERKERVIKLMRDVGLAPEYHNRYPHEFSGGQRQRIGIARSLALNPSLLICDEPVSALDVSIQAQILNLMKELQNEYQLTYIFISHNLAVVKYVCDQILVMYLGNIVEAADTETLFSAAVHPYTRALFDSVPVPNPQITSMQEVLAGDVPSPLNPPPGCCFSTRCKYAKAECKQVKPQLKALGDQHSVACHLY